MTRIEKGGFRWILIIAGVVLLGGALLFPRPVQALHDQGYICYVCHSLNPADIRTGSNSIRKDQAVLTPIPTPSGSAAWVGGGPITCDFCHKAADDVPTQNFALKAYRHPVRTIQDNAAVPNEIACGDCHNGNAGGANKDVTPLTMTTKDATDGYPDHDNVTAGYAHNLTSNPPHLTVPYWSASSLPGVTRANDTTFWTAVKGGTQDIVCWVCHESGRTNSPTRGPLTNAVSTKYVKADYTGSGNAKGHQIKTTVSGALGVGSALPCYDCHDSHGSASASLVLDNQSIYGSATGAVAVTTFTGANDKVVCAECHDTGNSVTQATKTHTAAYSGKVVEGMYPVDPFNGSSLHSSSGVTDNMIAPAGRNCLGANGGCHASPHNPVGESTGGQNCSVCHASTYAAMDNGSTGGYHHNVMTDAATYPTNATPGNSVASERTCLMCHGDHNRFSPLVAAGYLRGANLRQAIGTVPADNTTMTNRDFDNSLAGGGICVSCHVNSQTKNTTNLKTDTYPPQTTPVIAKNGFASSRHNYYAPSTFSSGSSTFQGNCSKCHNDTMAKGFQNSTNKFGLHDTGVDHLLDNTLSVSGGGGGEYAREKLCFGCHKSAGDTLFGGTMGAAATSVQAQFGLRSHHPVSAADQASGAAVDCQNCHNVHQSDALPAMAAQPDNTYAAWAYSGQSVSQRSNFCLKCHSGGTQPLTRAVSASTYIPYNVTIPSADNVLMNKSTNGARGHWSVAGQLQSSTVKACGDCHDQHGSTAYKLLGLWDNVSANKIGSTTLYNTATPTYLDNAAVCTACHTAAGTGYPATNPPTTGGGGSIMVQEGYRSATASDNGYFSPVPSGSVTTMRWPGKTAWDCTVLSRHNSATAGPAALGGRPTGDCNTCHDPHGTANAFNMLTDTMNAVNFKLCFDCHNGTVVTAKGNIQSYFPVSTGGTYGGSDNNFGHRIKTAGGKLAVGSALPCYDCHVIHGSANGNTSLKSDQRWGSLGDTKSNPANSRRFCLGCHTTGDATPVDGYGNTVTASDTIEGLNRIAARPLRLPSGVNEHLAANTTGCYVCHYQGANPYLDTTTRNAHNPNAGACDTCHGNAAGSNWPDNTAGVYPDRAGAHPKHVAAIASARSITGNQTCDTCHPGNPPTGHSGDNVTGTDQAEVTHMDNTGNGFSGPPTAGDYWSYAGGAAATTGTPVYFKNMGGSSDNDAFYDVSRKSCSSVDCHGGNATPNWLTGERFDTSAPVWTGGGSGIAATDLAQGGAVSVAWNTATDNGSTPSNPPVQYKLYWATSAANVFASPTGTMDNLATTSATVTGLTNGTPYYFGVRAKDSLLPTPNATTNTDNVSATPTALPTQYETVTWKLKKSNGVTVYTGQTTNLGTTCGTAAAIAAGTYGTYPVPGRGLLTQDGLTCATASTNNYVSNSSPLATAEEFFVAFYTDNTYATASTVTGSATGSTVGIMTSTTSPHTVRVRLAGVTSAGAHTLSANSVAQVVTTGTTNTAFPLDLSPLSVTVPAGGRLAVVFTWLDNNTTVSTSDHILMDNVAGFIGTISVSQPVVSDTTPPAWSGGVSGVTVSTTSSGTSLQVAWNTATDATAPPVKYDLYRGSSAATVFSAPTKTWTGLGVTSIVDSGLTEGATYYYGVRAKDSWTTPNATTNTDTAAGAPVSGAPLWTGGGSGIAATDLAQGGAVGVTWNTATDGDAPPVQYTLYWATSAANVFASPTGTMDNIAATSATVTGLTNGTPYYFGVRAKDSASPANATINTDNVTATPTPVPPQYQSVDWKLKKSNGVTVYTGATTNLGTTCGTLVSIAAAGTYGTYPVPGRGLLTTGALTCGTASDTNYVNNTSPATTPEELLAFYTDNTFATDTTVTGNASGSHIGIMASSTTAHPIGVRLAGVTSAGVHTLSTNTVTVNVTSGTVATAIPLDLSTLSVTVPAGGRLGAIFTWDDSSPTASGNDRFYIDNNVTASLMGVISVSQPIIPPADTTPPVFGGGVSGISPVNTGTGTSLQVSWNTATDAATPPVKYDLYRGASAATVFSAPTKTWTNLGTTSIIDSGLTSGTTYYYGVRAKDSAGTPNVTANTDNAFAVPSVPVSCTVCHGTPPATGAHLKHAVTDAVYTDCDKCHGDATRNVTDNYTTTGPLGLHNNGTVNLYFGRIPGETNAAWSGSAPPNDTCSTVDCHYNVTTPSWTTGSTNCTTCHGYPPVGTNPSGSVNHDKAGGVTLAQFKDAHNDCMACHGIKSSATDGSGPKVTHANYGDRHGDGYVTMNGPDATPGPAAGTEYDNANAGCNYACHLNDTAHQLAPSTLKPNTNYGDFGLGSCSYCHETGINSAPVVAAAGGHAGSCDVCHPLHQVKNATRQVSIPNNTGVGINYATHGGIFLGGTGTKSTGWAGANPTEAEICWGCHDGIGVSEWGVNNEAGTGSSTYNYGSLSTSNWTAATWTSGTPLFSYKTGAIASTHAATTSTGAGTTTRSGVDDLPTIRCSYCHDVHDRNLAAGDTASGKPYLRGSWRGNPYLEDGAPQAASSYPAAVAGTNPWGPVPRGGPVNGVNTGGYYIDQNSGNPVITKGWTPTQFGGLCDLCHPAGTGTRDGSVAGAEIDAMNHYDANGVGWVSGVNGHVNSVEGGTDNTLAARNIFGGRGGANTQTTQNTADHPFMLFNGTSMPGDSSGGFRGGSSAWGLTPAMVSRPMDGDGWVGTEWNNLTTPAARNLDLTGATVNSNFHTFPCSKCHNPHASRLPKLMITNCLDTKHNKWDDQFQVHPTTDTINAGRSISNWSTAQNCHRVGGNDPGDTRDTAADNTLPGNKGWNTVTPW